mmetsp:Transcript_283/g.652  ORF Transcript_283/g.652 Transcript_283/m.652 type:complete len:142 (-) Transcript_283:1618-2043(-)
MSFKDFQAEEKRDSTYAFDFQDVVVSSERGNSPSVNSFAPTALISKRPATVQSARRFAFGDGSNDAVSVAASTSMSRVLSSRGGKCPLSKNAILFHYCRPDLFTDTSFNISCQTLSSTQPGRSWRTSNPNRCCLGYGEPNQ